MASAVADAPLLMLLLWLEFGLYGLVVKKIQSPTPGGARAGSRQGYNIVVAQSFLDNVGFLALGHKWRREGSRFITVITGDISLLFRRRTPDCLPEQ